MNTSSYYLTNMTFSKSGYRKPGAAFLVLLHLFAFICCLQVKGLGSNGLVFLLFGLLNSCFMGCLALLKSNSRVLHFIVMWLTGTFTVKLAFCLNYPEDTPLAGLAKTLGNGFAPTVIEKYMYFSFGFAALVITSLVLPVLFPRHVKRSLDFTLPATNDAFAATKRFCLLALLFQAFTFFVLKLGRASILPPVILFPGVGGFLALLSETAGLVTTASVLAMGISREDIRSLGSSLFLAVIYISITVVAGWKRALFQIVLCLLWYFFFLASQRLRTRMRFLIVLFGAAAILLYFPVMTFRNLVVYEQLTPMEATKQMLNPDTILEQDYSKVFSKITDRFTGIEYFVIASHSFENKSLGMMYLINGNFAPIFTHEVMGVRVGVVTAIGSTLWGFFSATLGLNWIWICGVFVAVVIYIGETLCRRLSGDIGAVLSCEFCFVVWLAGLLGTSGAFLLYGKKAIILIAVLYILNKFTWGRRSMNERVNHIPINWNPATAHMQ